MPFALVTSSRDPGTALYKRVKPESTAASISRRFWLVLVVLESVADVVVVVPQPVIATLLNDVEARASKNDRLCIHGFLKTLVSGNPGSGVRNIELTDRGDGKQRTVKTRCYLTQYRQSALGSLRINPTLDAAQVH